MLFSRDQLGHLGQNICIPGPSSKSVMKWGVSSGSLEGARAEKDNLIKGYFNPSFKSKYHLFYLFTF